MKTTVELSTALLVEARKIAAREGVTGRTLIEQGLRHALTQRKQRGRFHGVKQLWSADRDFGRFSAVTVVNPLIA